MPSTSKGDVLLARFWGRVRFSDGCWEWTGFRNRHGYGVITAEQVKWLAPRLAWTLSRGPIPDGRHVLHHCDNPPCVRPDHLYVGTPADNSRDAWERGRAVPPPRPTAERQATIRHPSGNAHWSRQHPELVKRGDRHPAAKLTEDQVREIRRLSAEGWTLARLRERFGVRMSTLSYIVRRETWRHVE
jgi:hypothetical protein